MHLPATLEPQNDTNNHAKTTLLPCGNRKKPCKNAFPNHKQKKCGPAKPEPHPELQNQITLRISVDDLFPNNLIQYLLTMRLRQRHSQHIFNPAGVVQRHALRLVRR